jgi:hypothetical protein
MYHPKRGIYLAHINEKNNFFEYPSPAKEESKSYEDELKQQRHHLPYATQSFPDWYFEEDTIVSLLNTGQYELMNVRIKQMKQYHDLYQIVKRIHVYVGGTSYVSVIIDKMKDIPNYNIDELFIQQIELVLQERLNDMELDEFSDRYPNEITYFMGQFNSTLEFMKDNLNQVVTNIQFHDRLDMEEVDLLFSEKMSFCTYLQANIAIDIRGRIFIPMSYDTYRHWNKIVGNSIPKHHEQNLESLTHYSFFMTGKKAKKSKKSKKSKKNKKSKKSKRKTKK